MSESAKKRLIHGHTGHKHSEESKQKMRDNTLKMIKEGRYKQTQTKPHLELKKILNSLGFIFEEEFTLGYWSFDFYLVEYDILVEADGDYFHVNPRKYTDGPKTKTQKVNHLRDKKKNKYCKDNNRTLLRFWEYDILNNPKEIECTLKKLLILNPSENTKQ